LEAVSNQSAPRQCCGSWWTRRQLRAP